MDCSENKIANIKNITFMFLLLIFMFLNIEKSNAEEIHELADFGKIESVKKLIEKNPDLINKRDNEGMTLLHRASIRQLKKNNSDLLEYLIQKGAKVDARDKARLTPLHYASYNGLAREVRIIIQNGADIHSEDPIGLTPIHFAMNIYDTGVMEELISHGADVNKKTKDGFTPLHYAAKFDSHLAAKRLISAGVDVNARENSGKTPLHIACLSDRKNMVDLLVKNGAKIHAKDKYGKTAWQYATYYLNRDAVISLIKSGHKVKPRESDFDSYSHIILYCIISLPEKITTAYQ